MRQAEDHRVGAFTSQPCGLRFHVHIQAAERVLKASQEQQIVYDPSARRVLARPVKPACSLLPLPLAPHLIILATSRADSSTRGMPPPGCTLPPTKYRLLTPGARLGGLRNAVCLLFDDNP